MNRTLPGAKGPGHEEGQPAELVGIILVGAEDVAPCLGMNDRGIPLEPGEPFPDGGVIVLRVGQLSEQAPAARLGQLEVARRPRPPPARLAGIHHHRAEVTQFGIEQAELAPVPPRHEDQAARLVLDQTLELAAIFDRQLPRLDADIAEENDVELAQLVEPLGELLDVILVAARPACSDPGGRGGTTGRSPGRVTGRSGGSDTPSADTTRPPGPGAFPRGSRSEP